MQMASRNEILVYAYLIVILSSALCTSAQTSRLTKKQQHYLRSQGIVNYYVFEPYLEEKNQPITWPLTSPKSSITLDFFGSKLTFDLKLNDGLLSRHFHHTYQQGQDEKRVEGLSRPFCYYHGQIRQAEHTQDHVAIAACRGLEGTFEYRGKNYAILPIDNQIHILYRQEDSHDSLNDFTRQHRCDYAVAEGNDDRRKMMQEQRQASHQRRRRNALNETKYLELVLVNDKRSYDLFNGNLTTLESHTIQIANGVDLRYKTIQIRVALIGIVTWSVRDPITVTADASATLTKFANYSRLVLKSIHAYDSAQLLTGISLTGKSGLAYVSTMCLSNAVGISHNSKNVDQVAAILSHEIGHVFGMNHDTGRTCTCVYKPSSAKICVMSSVLSQPYPQSFSSCSVADLNKSLQEGLGSCLFNQPTKLATAPKCGNGFVEVGEECDCGSVAECTNQCCNATTCKLRASAKCASGPCCHNCQYKAKSILCRGAINDCDLPEYCSGKSELCPANMVKQNALQCSRNTGYCYNGACLTIDAQCRTLWGPHSADAASICWNRLNVMGNQYGYCKRSSSGAYTGCSAANVRCGKLHCWTNASAPVIGATWRLATVTFTQGSAQIPCKSISIDLGNDIPDPGIVIDGTKCGQEKICFNNECQNIKSVLNIKECNPANCSNHGICNSNGNCHCNAGYAPPDCSQSGNGGSIDSHGNQTTVNPSVVPSQVISSSTSTVTTSQQVSSSQVLSSSISTTLSSQQASSQTTTSSSISVTSSHQTSSSSVHQTTTTSSVITSTLSPTTSQSTATTGINPTKATSSVPATFTSSTFDLSLILTSEAITNQSEPNGTLANSDATPTIQPSPIGTLSTETSDAIKLQHQSMWIPLIMTLLTLLIFKP